MRVSELMRSEVWQTRPDATLAEAAARMRDHGVGALAVTDCGLLLGMVTERDLLWAMADGALPRVTIVAEYMSSPPIVATPEMDILAASRTMIEHDVRHLPVVDAGEVVGMVAARDLLVLA